MLHGDRVLEVHTYLGNQEAVIPLYLIYLHSTRPIRLSKGSSTKLFLQSAPEPVRMYIHTCIMDTALPLSLSLFLCTWSHI